MGTLADTFSRDHVMTGNKKYLPILVIIMATITLVTIQILCHVLNHVPDWFFFAPFSIAAVGKPERYIYGVGMSVVVILFALTQYTIFMVYFDRISPHQQWILKVRTSTNFNQHNCM